MSNVVELEPGLRRLLAPNPSPMTESGTNTYIVGEKSLCVIDPGPDDPAHMDRICQAIGIGQNVQAVLVTHAHRDHSALAPKLARHLNAPVMAYGDAKAGRSSVMKALVAAGLTGGGEGIDSAFQPDQCLADGAMIDLGTHVIRAIWTPGHMGNHLCFQWRDTVFSGDHVMGWASSIVSPPDGDMGAFMRALDTVQRLDPRRLFPGHGAPVEKPAHRIKEVRAHRLLREQQILSSLSTRPCSIGDLVNEIYADTPDNLKPAATRNVHAHLIALWEAERVRTDKLPFPEAIYHHKTNK